MKKLLPRIIAIVLIILLSKTSYCQENYLSGYIINLSGDTLYGFIDYRNWDKNPNTVYFKETLNDNGDVFHSINIKEFNVSDEKYLSGIVTVDKSPYKTQDLTFSTEYQYRVDTVFLQTMIYGDKSLFYYKDKDGKEHFFIKQDSGFDLLVFRKYLKVVDGNNVITSNNNFLRQLAQYFQDCPSIHSRLCKTTYSKKSLVNLFSCYYDCKKTKIEFIKKEERVLPEIGILAGLSLTKLSFKSEVFKYLMNTNYPPSIRFSTGTFMNIIIPRTQRKWSINNEFLFTSYTVSGRYDDYINENNYAIIYTTIGYSYLKLNNMFRFKYPVKGLFVFFNAGMSNGFAFAEANYEKKESKFYVDDRVEEGRVIDDPRYYEQGYNFGLGAIYKRYSVEIRYERGTGMSKYTTLKSTTNRCYFLLGFKF